MAKKKRKIAVLGALSDLNPAYSIAKVALDQMRMLREEDEDVVFVTTEEFKAYEDLPGGVEVRKFPRMLNYREGIYDEGAFEQYVFEASACLRTALADVTHCLTHDVLFLPCFLWVNHALRKAAEDLPRVKFYHWVHSGPSARPKTLTYPLDACYRPMPNSVYCYPNYTDIPRVAEMFDCSEAEVRTVYNTVDPAGAFSFHPLAKAMIKEYSVYDYETVCVYPTRMVDGKQPEKVVKLMGALKKEGQKVLLIFCNSWSTHPEQEQFMEGLRKIAGHWGLAPEEIRFTSEFPWEGVNMKIGAPHQVVINLMQVADLFVLPSVSETASLVMLEAVLCKNLCILNEDLLCMREFGGQKMDGLGSRRAVFAEFGSLTRPVLGYNPSEEMWFRDLAKRVVEAQCADKAIGYWKYVRRNHTPHSVWQRQLEPLLN